MPAFVNDEYDLRDYISKTTNPYNCITPILNLNTGHELRWYDNKGQPHTFQRPKIRNTDPSKVKKDFDAGAEVFRKISGFPDEEIYQLHRGTIMEGYNVEYYEALLKNLENNTGLMPANLALLNKDGNLITCDEEKCGCPYVMLTNNKGRRIPIDEEMLKMIKEAHNSSETIASDEMEKHIKQINEARAKADLKNKAPENKDTPEGASASENKDTPEGASASENKDTPEGASASENKDTPEGASAPENKDTPEGTPASENKDTPEGASAPENKDNSGTATKEDITPSEPQYPDYKADIEKELSSPAPDAQSGVNNMAAFLALSLEQRNIEIQKEIDKKAQLQRELEKKKKEDDEYQLRMAATQPGGGGSGGLLGRFGGGRTSKNAQLYNKEIKALKNESSELTKQQMWNSLKRKNIVDSVSAYNQNTKRINDALQYSKGLTSPSDIDAMKRQVTTLKSNLVQNLDGFNANMESVMKKDAEFTSKSEPGLIGNKQEMLDKFSNSLDTVNPFNTDNNPVAEEIKKDTGLDEANKGMMKKMQESIKAFIEALMSMFKR